MKLDPQAQKLLDAAAASRLPPVYTLPVDEARTRMATVFITRDNKESLYSIEDVEITGSSAKVRVYRPSPASGHPVVVFFHGGGWVLNSVETHDDLCRSLANNVGAVIVSVEYRLAPEHPYPAAIEDAYAAFVWASENAARLGGDSMRLAVAGDSSGGNQAAVVAIMARDKGGPAIAFQWLAYPVLDYYLPGTASYREMAKGYSMNRDFMIWFWNHYLPFGMSPDDPHICPLRAEHLEGLPRALVMAAYFDPLRDEAAHYAQRLKQAGVAVDYRCYDDQMHGFLMQRAHIDRARTIFAEAVKALRDALAVG